MDAVESVRVTHHAAERMRERMGLCKKSVQRMADRAWSKGIQIMQAEGRIKNLALRQIMKYDKGHDSRIYGHYLYIFQNNVLITVLPLLPFYRKAADGIRSKNVKKQKLREE